MILDGSWIMDQFKLLALNSNLQSIRRDRIDHKSRRIFSFVNLELIMNHVFKANKLF